MDWDVGTARRDGRQKVKMCGRQRCKRGATSTLQKREKNRGRLGGGGQKKSLTGDAGIFGRKKTTTCAVTRKNRKKEKTRGEVVEEIERPITLGHSGRVSKKKLVIQTRENKAKRTEGSVHEQKGPVATNCSLLW